jgi:hypothetical protein
MNKVVENKLSIYRYEFLLFALLLLIFDKIFFLESDFYLKIVWPFNMIVISIACYGITINHNKIVKVLRIVFGFISILMPFGFMIFQQNAYFIQFLVAFFSIYYSFIFGEVMYQITLTKVVRINIIIGSFCGFMLLSMISLFTFLIIENYYPNSFHGISVGDLGKTYTELSYFSFITLTSIGFGDIYPITNMSRLTTAFFGMTGQFYMVAVVGIIISKFTSKN